jgi:hypothetical protein
MSPTIHTILLAVHAAALTAFISSSYSATYALATPLPMPLMAPDYASSNNHTVLAASKDTRRKIRTKKFGSRKTVNIPAAATPSDPMFFGRRFQPVVFNKREVAHKAFQSKMDMLNKYYGEANDNSKDLSMRLLLSLHLIGCANQTTRRGPCISFVNREGQ